MSDRHEMEFVTVMRFIAKRLARKKPTASKGLLQFAEVFGCVDPDRVAALEGDVGDELRHSLERLALDLGYIAKGKTLAALEGRGRELYNRWMDQISGGDEHAWFRAFAATLPQED